jgi:multiple sugar transport system permease protein
MGTNSVTKKSVQEKILDFISKKRSLILLLAFIVALFLPISSTRMGNLSQLIDLSVMKWVAAMNSLYSNEFSSFIALINMGIETTILFFQNMIDFFSQLFQFNLEVISETGYFLTALYFIIPIVIILSAVLFILNYMNKSSFLNFLSPKKLIITLLFIPLTNDFLWIGAIVAIILSCYWYIDNLQQEKSENTILTYPELISWKKALLLISVNIIFILALLSQFSDETYSITSFTNLNPNLLMLGIIGSLFLIAIIWIIFNSQISSRTVLDIVKIKYEENMTIKRVFYFIIIIILGIPLIDRVILQSSSSGIVFFLLNLPWILGYMIHNPLEFSGELITIVKNSFDIIVNATREISKGLVPITPSDISILGAIQPSFWITLLIFIIFLLIYVCYLIIYEQRSEESPIDWKNGLKRHSNFLKVAVLLFVFLIFVYVFEPRNYNSLFGDYYDMQTSSFSSILTLGILLTFIGAILAAITWGVIQVRQGRSWRIIVSSVLINSTAAFIAIIMVVPFIWMLKNSLQSNSQNTIDFAKQGLIPDPFTTRNYAQIFGLVPPSYETLEYQVITWLFNSIVTALFVTGFLVIFSAMAGYVLAKRTFIGRRLLFTLIIAIQMVPPYVQVIPLYLELNRLGFVGSLLGVIFPFLIQPFSIFLCAEFMRGIPDDYLDAARVDGYSEIEIFRKIVLPLSIPVISVMIIINIIGNWNAFMWPLLVLEQSEFGPLVRTLPLGMYRINAELQEQVGVILALATVIVLPIFVILFLAQDYIKKGVTVEGLKG